MSGEPKITQSYIPKKESIMAKINRSLAIVIGIILLAGVQLVIRAYKSIVLLDVKSETQKQTITENLGAGKFSGISSNKDGSLAAFVQEDGTVSLWYLDGTKMGEFKDPDRKIKSVILSPDSSMLATIAEDGTTKLWEIEQLNELIIKDCDRVRDYLQNNPNVSESDRQLCGDVPVLATSQNSTTPPPDPSTLTPEDFRPDLQAIAEDYYTRGSEQADSKYIKNFPNILAKSSTNAKKKYDAYVNRGVIYYRQKKYTQAIEDYNEAIKIEPENVDAYISRGIAYSSMGDHEKAISDYEKAISIDPSNVDAYYAMGFTQTLIKGKKQEAIENYQKAADLYKKDKPQYSENALKKIEELRTSQSP
jgi:tetratricopeptide (TPR) repeat protein